MTMLATHLLCVLTFRGFYRKLQWKQPGCCKQGTTTRKHGCYQLGRSFQQRTSNFFGDGVVGLIFGHKPVSHGHDGKEFKRPLPAPVIQESASASSREVERRVFPRPGQEVKCLMQRVRDIPGRSWQEERGAVLQTSVRSWVMLTDTWLPESSTLIAVLHNCKTFKEKARMLVDVFYNKSPQALMKRVSRFQRFCTALQVDDIRFPCVEEQVYNFLKYRKLSGERRHQDWSRSLRLWSSSGMCLSVGALQNLTGKLQVHKCCTH